MSWTRSKGLDSDEVERFVLAIFSLIVDEADSTSFGCRSVVVRFLFEGGGGGTDPSAGRFLQDLCRVPGRLSGPRRLGTASYWHSLDRRTQLLHTGRVESQRILRARL